jgi:hypothetical protein
VARLFASLAGLAEARVRRVTQRARLRATLIGIAVLLGLIALGFGLLAATVALADEIGLLEALLVMAGLALLGLLVVLGVLAAEARKARRLAARRGGLDRDLARAALLSAAPARLPSRGVLGLVLVALGAVLVLRARGDD